MPQCAMRLVLSALSKHQVEVPRFLYAVQGWTNLLGDEEMKTKNVAGKDVSVKMVKRVAMAVGVFLAFVAAATSVFVMWPTSPGPAVVVAAFTVVSVALYLRAIAVSASRERMTQESCNWHLDEEHLFMDGEPFSLATAE